jgi:thiazole/oxazole-forming peptide maturase SagD family component
MQLKSTASDSTGSKRMLRRMLSPLCGLNPQINLSRRNWLDSRFIAAGADLTGVHVLLQQTESPASGYHIGGAGIFLEEVLWRTLGETVERYAQLISGIHYQADIIMATYDELVNSGARVISAEKFAFFTDAQYLRPEFPFRPFSRESVIGWLKAPSLLDEGDIWVPAQLVLIGYIVKQMEGEPWLLSAVTTGSAAHTNQVLALRTALLELIELDSVIGHWYSPVAASEIVLDQRTRAIERLIERQFFRHKLRPAFYWLPNADLPGMTVACVARQKPGVLPAVGIGLGCSLSLTEAMYKALLEAVGVEHLAPALLAVNSIDGNGEARGSIDPQQIFDLDQNVAFYAAGENSALIDAKFSQTSSLMASELPPDSMLEPAAQARFLIESFRQTGKELVILDLTTVDVRSLGFTALRVWSPDTLGMSLPSCVPMLHPRFQVYGGCSHDAPHPYP